MTADSASILADVRKNAESLGDFCKGLIEESARLRSELDSAITTISACRHLLADSPSMNAEALAHLDAALLQHRRALEASA